MGDVVLLLKILEVVVGSDLAELIVLFKQFGDFSFIGLLVDFVRAVKFLHKVHQP